MSGEGPLMVEVTTEPVVHETYKISGKLPPAKKDDKQKLEMHLLMEFSKQLEDLVGVQQFGANKYGERNWQAGDQAFVKRVEGALLRHLFKGLNGEWLDPETNKPHLAHAVWNCMALMWYKEKGFKV